MGRAVLILSLIFALHLALIDAQGTWSVWTCNPSNTSATRSRTMDNCTVTAMNDCIETENTTDVVLQSIWSDWAPAPVTCSDSVSVVQTRSITSCVLPTVTCSGECVVGTTESRTINTTVCEESDFGMWTSWNCFNNTAASRSRTIMGCVSNDPNFCTQNQTATDPSEVVSQNSWTEWGPMIPSCSNTSNFEQARDFLCIDASVIECDNTCGASRRQTRTEPVSICCTGLEWSTWSMWSPDLSNCQSSTSEQSRQRYRIPCTSPQTCESNCMNGTQTRPVTTTQWDEWGVWSPMEEQLCGTANRTRQRTCVLVNDTITNYCSGVCLLNSMEAMTDCCIANLWSEWTEWIVSTDCPRTRSRTRNCLQNSGASGQRLCSTSQCDVNEVDTEMEPVTTPGCVGPTPSESSSFPPWAIAIVSAVGVVIAIAGFIGITVAAKYLSGRGTFTPGADKGLDRPEYEDQSGVPAQGTYTVASDTLQFKQEYSEKQF